MLKNIQKNAKKLLPIIGLIIIIYIIYTLDFQEIKYAFFSIKPIFIIASILLTIPRLLVRNYIWILIQRQQKINLRFFRSLKILLIGYFYGVITPSYVGRFVRIMYIKERTNDPYGKLFMNTIIEAFVHTAPLYLMILYGAFLILEEIPFLLNITIGWLVIITLIIIYFIRRQRGEKVFLTLIKFFVPKKFKEDFNKFVLTFYRDFPKVRSLILPFLLSFITWIIIFSQFYIFVIALDLPIPYFYFVLLFPVANVVSFIPISFAGLGTRELSAIFIFSTLYGVSEEKIFVVSLLGFLITDILTGFYGFILSLTEAGKNKIKIFD